MVWPIDGHFVIEHFSIYIALPSSKVMSQQPVSDPFWASLLSKPYKITALEKRVYLDRQEDATCNEMYAKFICDEMKARNLCNNLYKLYDEAVYGSDPDVKRRMIHRIYTVRQKVL